MPHNAASSDAELQVVSLHKILTGDKNATKDLLQACMDLGFFHLGCRDVDSGNIIRDVREMYDLSVSFFDLPQEEKSKWLVDRDHDENLVIGHKPAGHGNGPVEGVKDGLEGIMD
ncbi:Hypothetical protein D9617_57g029070 [Elsinoe fawcettii]|nr:Hypothetical protein D9617_57g029070 [Elsinoe fawcettii]